MVHRDTGKENSKETKQKKKCLNGALFGVESRNYNSRIGSVIWRTNNRNFPHFMGKKNRAMSFVLLKNTKHTQNNSMH